MLQPHPDGAFGEDEFEPEAPPASVPSPVVGGSPLPLSALPDEFVPLELLPLELPPLVLPPLSSLDIEPSAPSPASLPLTTPPSLPPPTPTVKEMGFD